MHHLAFRRSVLSAAIAVLAASQAHAQARAAAAAGLFAAGAA